MKTYWVNMTYACAGVICDDNDIVINAAPIFKKWMIGKPFQQVIRTKKLIGYQMIKKYKLKVKEPEGFYCKLFNNYRTDGKCTDMACEFCESYYDPNRKRWYYHPESESYFLDRPIDVFSSTQTEDVIEVEDKIKTRVVNIKKHKYDIYCGRGSDFGNPFIIGKDGNRQEVIKKYYEYFYSNKELQKKALSLKNKILGCFCVPEDCHVEIIAEFIENNYYSQLYGGKK